MLKYKIQELYQLITSFMLLQRLYLQNLSAIFTLTSLSFYNNLNLQLYDVFY